MHRQVDQIKSILPLNYFPRTAIGFLEISDSDASRASVNARPTLTQDFKQHHHQQSMNLTLLNSAREAAAVDMESSTSSDSAVMIRDIPPEKKSHDMSAKITFFGLTLAIRKKIYTFANIVDTTHQLRVCYGKHKDRLQCSIPATFATLTKVNKQIRAEVSKLFFRKNEFFIFDCKHELITRPDCVCPIILPQMRRFSLEVHYYVRAKVWKEHGVWKAKLVIPRSVKEEWLVNTGREFRPNRELEMYTCEGEKALEMFRYQVAREDGWTEHALIGGLIRSVGITIDPVSARRTEVGRRAADSMIMLHRDERRDTCDVRSESRSMGIFIPHSDHLGQMRDRFITEPHNSQLTPKTSLQSPFPSPRPAEQKYNSSPSPKTPAHQ
ncbi:uncharacterized protein MYCFIDRAFT_179192 [Pseudocercospora fijiensis CIRAD86]|uniref:Uncharacterized protein n=1 Tax=Pseudocercospora fijiensis (strain CIRAD86) TaxID=383855 RepID=M2YIW1_PSEFD|nr:uncharacterized protein MYCFIDRAFT_179192 [Pseudocercospora fijiensis CIRAD86]EME77690.1 hypothetical protein MYCFIDRAFT_179192 [Pseudocercospora fijiensis CIRAD86]